MPSIELHGRSYALPSQPVVVVCIDGCDHEYIQNAVQRGICPNLSAMVKHGFSAIADCVMPSFTNPNNASIVTGTPPKVHGIAGNYYLDRDSGEEIMVKDARMLRGETLLALLSKAGVPTAMVTAKDKLTKLIGHGLEGICLSSEKAAETSLEDYGFATAEALVGRPQPDMYSPDLSLYVLDVGVALLEQKKSQVLYLSLSDYVQHKYAPGEPESDAFLQAIDERIGRFMALGAIVGCVADHGMSYKTDFQGRAQLLFVEDVLDQYFGMNAARVICPITDPFVRHHGALGSFVRVYLKDATQIDKAARLLRQQPGVFEVLTQAEAAEKLDLPFDREADLVVISKEDWALGAKREQHDLSAVQDRPLRTHGGYSEQRTPFLISHPISAEGQEWVNTYPLHNYDIFHVILNYVR
jgi:phosphonoacetate hydrolase